MFSNKIEEKIEKKIFLLSYCESSNFSGQFFQILHFFSQKIENQWVQKFLDIEYYSVQKY